MFPVPNLPHVLYSAGPDSHGRWMLNFGCLVCDPSGASLYRRQCSNPAKTNNWVAMWARQHVHHEARR